MDKWEKRAIRDRLKENKEDLQNGLWGTPTRNITTDSYYLLIAIADALGVLLDDEENE